jgi:hypothetical protein
MHFGKSAYPATNSGMQILCWPIRAEEYAYRSPVNFAALRRLILQTHGLNYLAYIRSCPCQEVPAKEGAGSGAIMARAVKSFQWQSRPCILPMFSFRETNNILGLNSE